MPGPFTNILPYTKGIWAILDATGPVPQTIIDNNGVIGLLLKEDWSAIESVKGVYDFSIMDAAIASAQAAGFTSIALGISNSSAKTPAWLTNGGPDSLPPDQILQLLDPAQVHTTFCTYIPSPLFWNATYHAARLALIAAAGAYYANNRMVTAVYASFADHNSLDWNILDTQGLISCGARGIGGDHTVDQVKDWLDKGWTRALMLQVGKDICDAVGTAFPHQNIKLPIGGLQDNLADAPAYQGSVILVSGNVAIQAATYVQSTPNTPPYVPYTHFTAADVGQPITSASIPAGATIATVTDPTHATLSAGHAPTASVTELATFPNRNPDLFDPLAPVRGNYTTLAREIQTYVATKPYAPRFFIQRNTVDANWGTPADLLQNPPAIGSERYIKKMIALAAPLSGLQTVSGAAFCTAGQSCRQNGNRICTSPVQVMQDSLNIMLSYGFDAQITFAEIFTADASDPDFYDMVRAATVAMGGLPRAGTQPPPIPVPPGVEIPIRTANFRDDVLWPLACKMGLDPANDLMVEQADCYADFINSWVRKTWDCVDWPEWTVIEERIPDATHYVAFDQTGKTSIGKVLKVYLLDPSIFRTPADTPYRLLFNGIHVGFEHGGTVFIKFMKRPPRYTSELHDPLRTYSINDLTYDSISGNVYISLVNLNTAILTDTTAWELVAFPITLIDIVVSGAYSDALRQEGQFAKADAVLADTKEILDKRIRAALGLPYDLLTDQQRPAPRYRATNIAVSP